MAGAAAGGAVAAAAALAQAIKASGAIVRVDPADFNAILGKQRGALIVHARSGFVRASYQYLTSYKGLTFFTRSSVPLILPGDAEQIIARAIWVPS
jgi:hypothetical protein